MSKTITLDAQQNAPIDLQVVVRPEVGYQPFADATSATWRFRKKGSADAATEIVLALGTDLLDVNNCRWRLPLTAVHTATVQTLEVELVVVWAAGSPAKYTSNKALLNVQVAASIP